MAFGSFDSGSHTQQNAEINMVPLIDVMLVLLVIFIITAPLLTHAVKLDLPVASSAVNQVKPENIQIAIDGDGKLYWNGEVVERKAMQERLEVSAQKKPQPEIQFRADKKVPYQRVSEVLSDAAKVGMSRIGFVSDPQ
jgi:biopolymer transport protein ExbD